MDICCNKTKWQHIKNTTNTSNDVELNEEQAKKIGLNKRFVIKTTKIYTGSKSKLGNKIGDLPVDIKEEFIIKYKDYQNKLIEELNN